MKVRDHLSTATGIDWVMVKDEWPNDRIVYGAFTTPKLDKQRDRVLLTGDRLNYVFKYGNLIWEHHSDSREPVVVLGDCLAIGFDKTGKTYGAWGIKDGTETIDEKWGHIIKQGRSGGFSIGGKIPPGTRVCAGDGCVLTDPEVLEVSYTLNPANDDATVYWVNKFAKSVFDRIGKDTPDTYEVRPALKRFDKYLTELFGTLPEEEPDIEKFEHRPCVLDLQNGLMEAGLKKDEVQTILQDHVETLKKNVIGDKTMTDEELKKEEMAPAPTPEVSNTGNEVLQTLRAMLDKLDSLPSALMALMQPSVPSDASAEPPAEPPAPESDNAPEEGPSEPEAEQPPKDDEPEQEEKKPEDKTEKSEPIGTDEEPDMPPEPSGGGSEIEGADSPPDAEAPSGGGDIASPAPEVESDAPGMDTGESEHAVGTPQPDIPTQTEAIKGLAKKPESVTIEDIFKKHGIIRLPVPNLRPKVEKVDIVTGMPLKGETLEKAPEKMSLETFFKDNKGIKVRRN